MSRLFIFDKFDNLLTILSNKGNGSRFGSGEYTQSATMFLGGEDESNDNPGPCPFWDAPFEEELNKGETFEFTIPGDHPDAVHVVPGNQVAFKDRDGEFRIFWIKELDELYADSVEKRWICEAGFLENNGEPIEDIRSYDTNALDALKRIMQGRRWQPGIVAELGINSINFYFESVTKGIEKIINIWGGELRTRITVEDNRITGRFIDILPRRGADTGKRWVAGKDIIKHRRTILSYPITAVYPRGKGVESGEGYSRRIDIADIEWSVANGDPVDKPLGQKWIGDPAALQEHGIPNADGSLRHVFGFFDDSEEEDPLNLIQSGWNDLQKRNKLFESYELSVLLLEKITGYEHEKVRLGDTTYAVNRKVKPEITTEQRVIKFKYYLDDPSDERAEVVLGEAISLFTDDKRLDRVEAQLNDKIGLITEPVSDADFPNEIPSIPSNAAATGLFKSILVKWDFNAASYIASYEVYGSQEPGFTPDASNLLWRGKAGGYLHNATSDEQWYFRVRAVNTHGTASPYTKEVTASTVRVGQVDYELLSIIDAFIVSISADKLTAGTIDAGIIDVINLMADNITSGTLDVKFVKILGDINFYWDDNNIRMIDPANTNKQIRIGKYDGTNYGIGFTNDGGATWTTAIGFDGAVAQRLEASSGNYKMVLENDSLKAIYDSFQSGRVLLSLKDTVPNMFDGDLPIPRMEGNGKMYSQRVRIYVPAGTYTPGALSSQGGYIETTVSVNDYTEVAIAKVCTIIPTAISREFYAYETTTGRVGGELESFKLRISPHYQVTVSAHYVDIDVLIVGWR